MQGLKPKSCHMMITPNLLGMLRLSYLGETTVLVAPMAKFRELADEQLLEFRGLQSYVDELDKPTWEKLLAAKDCLYRTVLRPPCALYVPAGWVIFERCLAGQVITSVRRCVLYKTPGDTTKENIEACEPFVSSDLRKRVDAIKNML